MSKKNKDIEVQVSEGKATYQGKQVNSHSLTIGKKVIGQILAVEPKKFIVQVEDQPDAVVRTVDEGIDFIIRQWNLAK